CRSGAFILAISHGLSGGSLSGSDGSETLYLFVRDELRRSSTISFRSLDISSPHLPLRLSDRSSVTCGWIKGVSWWSWLELGAVARVSIVVDSETSRDMSGEASPSDPTDGSLARCS